MRSSKRELSKGNKWSTYLNIKLVQNVIKLILLLRHHFSCKIIIFINIHIRPISINKDFHKAPTGETWIFFTVTLFLKNKLETSEKNMEQCFLTEIKSTCQISVTFDQSKKQPKMQVDIFAQSPSINQTTNSSIKHLLLHSFTQNIYSFTSTVETIRQIYIH